MEDRLGGEQLRGRVEEFRSRFGGEQRSPWPALWNDVIGRDCFGFLDSNLELPASWQLRAGFPSWAAGGNRVAS